MLQGKPCFPSKGARNPGLTGSAVGGGSSRWSTGCPWDGGWVPPRQIQQLLIGAEQGFLPGQGPLPSLAGADEPATLLRPSLGSTGFSRAALGCCCCRRAGRQPKPEACPAPEEDGCVWGRWWFSLQPQELLYCWGEAGPAPTGTGQAKAHIQLVTRSVSVDSMIVRLCTPVRDYLCIGVGCRSHCGIFVLCKTSKWENHRMPVTPFNPFRLQDSV